MNVTRMVSWGFVDFDTMAPTERIKIASVVFKELKAQGFLIIPCKTKYRKSPLLIHQLWGPANDVGHRKWLYASSLQLCCKEALKLLEQDTTEVVW